MKQKWLDMLGEPSGKNPRREAELIRHISQEEFDAELYVQQTGDGKSQRVMIVFPKHIETPAPAVVVPFYFPEAMLGFDPVTGKVWDAYKGIEMMLHLVRRGYVAICADTYHLTYIESEKDQQDFTRWQDAAKALRADHPEWTGMGKLVFDTRMLIDLLEQDVRVDSGRIGIAGHSLGGKMAFYTGCLDERIRVILASDFGMGWDQTNWRDDWYWGEKVDELIAAGMDHTQLLILAAPKPFCLIAGLYDTEESGEMMKKATGYGENDERLLFINHATGHRPPMWALEEGYDFLDRWMKE